MKKRWWLLGASLLLTALIFVRILYAAGQLRELAPHFAGKCTQISGMPGAEDITFHRGLGYAYVSSDDRRATIAKKPVQGGIYRYDPRTHAAPVLLTSAFKATFHPHGISLFVDAQGKQTLYAINHPELGVAQIEKFELGADGLLVHKKTLRDPKLVSINDLVAVDAERVYVTNDHAAPFGVRQLIEDLAQLIRGKSAGRGTIVYFDGRAFREVLHGMAYANGINASHDGKTVYVAQSIGQSVSLYARNASSGELSLRKVLPLATAADNIELDEQGDLYIGAHPRTLDFFAHALDGSGATRAPSQVLRVKLGAPGESPEELYLSEGDPLSAVATAAVQGKLMLLGPVFDAQLLRCELP